MDLIETIIPRIEGHLRMPPEARFDNPWDRTVSRTLTQAPARGPAASESALGPI